VSGGREKEYGKELGRKRSFGKAEIDGEALLLEDPRKKRKIKGLLRKYILTMRIDLQ
jgi:hypothetical protein